jgi:hypothetical protein
MVTIAGSFLAGALTVLLAQALVRRLLAPIRFDQQYKAPTIRFDPSLRRHLRRL